MKTIRRQSLSPSRFLPHPGSASSPPDFDYRALYEQSPYSIMIFDPAGRFVMANESFVQHWEITADQFPADYSLLRDAELERAGVLPLVHRAFGGEIIKLPPLQYDIGGIVPRPSSCKLFQAVLYPVRDEHGIQQQVVVLHTEVAEHTDAEAVRKAKSAHEERRVRAILESTTDGVILLDTAWRMTYINQPAIDIVSSGRPLIGFYLWDAFPHVMNEKMVAEYSKAPADRTIVDYEELYPEADDKWLHIRAFPTAEGTALFFQDMTERRRSEKAHRDNEKLVVVGRLAVSIAHEINNPLESIANLLHLLQGDQGMAETALKHVQMAQQELHRVALITTNTLKFFKRSTEASQISLVEVITSVLTLFQGRLRQSGIQILTRYRDHAAYIGFSTELRQVFANFIGNALDATAPGGRIHIRVRPVSLASGRRPGVLVTIADTGIGMSRHTLRHIYEAFFTTKEITGTGLGLWVSAEVINKHDGRVRVRSREAALITPSAHPGSDAMPLRRGTVFQITFPYENQLDRVSSLEEASESA